MERRFTLILLCIVPGDCSIQHRTYLTLKQNSIHSKYVYLKHFDEFFSMFRYKYYFPFLDTKGEVIIEDNRVGPLYKHVFPPALSPGLSFIGLPWLVNDFYKCG